MPYSYVKRENNGGIQIIREYKLWTCSQRRHTHKVFAQKKNSWYFCILSQIIFVADDWQLCSISHYLTRCSAAKIHNAILASSKNRMRIKSVIREVLKIHLTRNTIFPISRKTWTWPSYKYLNIWRFYKRRIIDQKQTWIEYSLELLYLSVSMIYFLKESRKIK